MKHFTENPVKTLGRSFMLFWGSQSVSQLGSSMTSYALIIWAYKQTNSAMTVSLLTFFSYLPYVIVSMFAGAFVDRHSKKVILLISDSIAAVCTISIFLLEHAGMLEIQYIYLVNAIIGISKAFQNPASTVSIGLMVPKENLSNASGMNSFSSNLLSVVAPMMAATVLSFAGLSAVLLVDFASFLFAFFILLFLIRIPEQNSISTASSQSVIAGTKEGLAFLKTQKGLLSVIICLALMNFFSAITYENILGPMILSRTGGNDVIYGTVSAVLGVGGIIGGLYVSLFKLPKNLSRNIAIGGALSFALGDFLMGIGQSLPVWIVAGLCASIPIPMIIASSSVVLYDTVPESMQGRVFAVRNTLQYASIPCGILLGGYLADYVFEPFMQGSSSLALFLQKLVGSGAGSGMAVMFLCTAVLGSLTCIISGNTASFKQLAKQYEERS